MGDFMRTATQGVAVSVYARLHLGFLDLNGDLGRRFGGIGLAINEPVGRLTLRRAGAPVMSRGGACCGAGAISAVARIGRA